MLPYSARYSPTCFDDQFPLHLRGASPKPLRLDNIPGRLPATLAKALVGARQAETEAAYRYTTLHYWKGVAAWSPSPFPRLKAGVAESYYKAAQERTRVARERFGVLLENAAREQMARLQRCNECGEIDNAERYGSHADLRYCYSCAVAYGLDTETPLPRDGSGPVLWSRS